MKMLHLMSEKYATRQSIKRFGREFDVRITAGVSEGMWAGFSHEDFSELWFSPWLTRVVMCVCMTRGIMLSCIRHVDHEESTRHVDDYGRVWRHYMHASMMTSLHTCINDDVTTYMHQWWNMTRHLQWKMCRLLEESNTCRWEQSRDKPNVSSFSDGV